LPIAVPNLDDLNWKQLAAEGRSLIPSSAPDWTNHNVSDPGITLLELFAHFAEMLIYRVNRTSDANLLEFLQLIDGKRRASTESDVQDDIRTTLAGLRQIHRAVTPKDFEILALAVNQNFLSADREQIARVKCVEMQDPESNNPTTGTQDAPGHIRLVVVSARRARPSKALLHAVRRALEPARLLTTRIDVVPPRFVTCSLRVTLVPRPNADATTIRAKAIQTLEKFFDPLEGGFDSRGWPFGRSVYVSEIYQLLAGVEGVDYITKSRNPVSGDEMDELIVGPEQEHRLRLNAAGELEAIALASDELVAIWIDEADISVTER
jgi:hypothetical protein